MVATFAAALLLGAQQQAVLTTYRIGSQEVSVVVPRDRAIQPNPGPTVAWGGDTYSLAPILIRRPGQHSWAAFAERYRGIHAGVTDATKEWRVKLVVFTRGDLLVQEKNGVLTQRRGSIEDEDITEALKSLALFSAMVEVATNGQRRVTAYVDVERLPARDVLSAASGAYGQAFSTDYFTARLNGAGFVPEDGVYRGPFDSVIGLHAALFKDVGKAEVNGSPISSIPFHSSFDPTSPEVLANALFVEWRRHLMWRAQKMGFGASLDDVPVASDRDFGCPISAEFTVAPELLGDDWTAGFAGPDVKPVSQGAAWRAPRLEDAVLASLSVGQTTDLDAQTASFTLSRNPQAQVLGWKSLGSRDVLVGVGAGNIGNPVVSSLAAPETPLTRTFEPGEIEMLQRGGPLKAQSFADPDRGPVGQVSVFRSSRSGWLRLFEAPAGTHLYDAKEKPVVRFWIKSSKGQPMSVRLVSADSRWEGSVLTFFGRHPAPFEGGVASTSYTVDAEGTWKEVVFRVPAAQGSMPVAAVEFGPSPESALQEPLLPQAQTFWIDDFAIASEGEGLSPNAVRQLAASATSADPEERALFAASIGDQPTNEQRDALRLLLSDPVEKVVLAALQPYARFKDGAVETRLSDLARNLNPRISESAMRGLVFLGTESAKSTLRTIMGIGPFDWNKGLAARFLAPSSEGKAAGSMSALIGSRSWQTRREAARAIGQLKGSEPGIVLMAFLQDDDPSVRLAAAVGAVATQAVVAQRLQWTAVNDSSDVVRAAASARLIRSGFRNFPQEGYRAFRDESAVTRLRLVEILAPDKNPADRNWFAEALKDTEPLVRAAAFKALSLQSVPPRADEVAAVAEDDDPRVQAALVAAVEAKSVQVPGAALDLLRQSRDPNVAARARRLD